MNESLLQFKGEILNEHYLEGVQKYCSIMCPKKCSTSCRLVCGIGDLCYEDQFDVKLIRNESKSSIIRDKFGIIQNLHSIDPLFHKHEAGILVGL